MREQFPSPTHTPEQPPVSIDTVLGVGKRAVASLIRIAPRSERLQQVDQGLDFAASTVDTVRTVKSDLQDAYQRRGEILENVGNHVANSTLETGRAGAQAALRFVLSEYGIGRKIGNVSEEDKLHILDTHKFGQNVLHTLLDPKVRLLELARGSLGAAKQAASRKATFQLADTRQKVTQVASNYLEDLRVA